MEHANSTAIDVNASTAIGSLDSVASVTAHEFFHLWNVKRIRPITLQPIDYTRENYTRALWFAEGVNTTVSDSMLVRAGLLDEKQFLRRLAAQIAIVQYTPAHRTQSLEESSLDTWLERYSYYRQPQRSLSYYIKGQIVGVLLDLSMRQATEGKKSLRDLFQYLNTNFAKQRRFYNDSSDLRRAVETICSRDFSAFFNDYVSGIKEIPYDEIFKTVGLKIRRQVKTRSSAGFTSSRNFGPKPTIDFVESNSEAARIGIRQGDVIEYIEGKLPEKGYETQIAEMAPGKQLRLKISNARGTSDVRITLVARQVEQLDWVDVENLTSAQQSRRAAWIRGDSE